MDAKKEETNDAPPAVSNETAEPSPEVPETGVATNEESGKPEGQTGTDADTEPSTKATPSPPTPAAQASEEVAKLSLDEEKVEGKAKPEPEMPEMGANSTTTIDLSNFTGGAMLMCNTKTWKECWERKLLGAPSKYWESVVSKIAPGSALFCYNNRKKCLYGVFAMDGAPAENIVSGAWGSTQYSAQVRMKETFFFKPLSESQLPERTRSSWNKLRVMDKAETDEIVRAFLKSAASDASSKDFTVDSEKLFITVPAGVKEQSKALAEQTANQVPSGFKPKARRGPKRRLYGRPGGYPPMGPFPGQVPYGRPIPGPDFGAMYPPALSWPKPPAQNYGRKQPGARHPAGPMMPAPVAGGYGAAPFMPKPQQPRNYRVQQVNPQRPAAPKQQTGAQFKKSDFPKLQDQTLAQARSTVVIDHVPEHVSDDVLKKKQLFGQFGNILNVARKDNDSVCITFDSEGAAKAAVEKLNKKKVRFRKSKKNAESQIFRITCWLESDPMPSDGPTGRV